MHLAAKHILLALSVGFVALLVHSQTIDPTAISTQDISNVFSLNRLGEYNQLIECLSKIHNEFTHCNEEAQRKGELVLRYVDEKSEMGTLLKCCGIWQVRDCWVASARINCTEDQVDQLYNMPGKFMPGLGELCHNYQPGSTSCYTPHLIVAAIVFGAFMLLILTVLIIIVLVRFYFRKKQQSGRMENPEHGEEQAEKVKLTSNNNSNNNNYIETGKSEQ